MPEPAHLHRRHCFFVETHAARDALVRVLTLFAVQSADLAAVSLTRAHDGLSIRIEADGLCDGRAEVLMRRLEGLPVVRSVGLGWRGLAQTAA
jgi:hypothetical protein